MYAGVTTNVDRRFAEHQDGGRRCARYLRGRAPLKLVFQIEVGERSLALKAEWRIKGLPKHAKEQIVRAQPGREDLLQRLALRPARAR